MLEDPTKAVYAFAKELEEKMKSQFAYLLDAKSRNFQPIFWVATYLSPVTRVLLSSDIDKMQEVRKFLKSKSWKFTLVFTVLISILLRIDTRSAPQSE